MSVENTFSLHDAYVAAYRRDASMQAEASAGASAEAVVGVQAQPPADTTGPLQRNLMPKRQTLQLVTAPVKYDAAQYPVEIRQSTLLESNGIVGQRGLFSTRAILKGEIVAEYYGDIIHKSERVESADGMNDYVGFLGFPGEIFMHANKTEYVDAETGAVLRAWGRFCNMARGIGKQNAAIIREYGSIPMKRRANGKEVIVSNPVVQSVRVLLRATKNIAVGEEILTSYGPGYQV